MIKRDFYRVDAGAEAGGTIEITIRPRTRFMALEWDVETPNNAFMIKSVKIGDEEQLITQISVTALGLVTSGKAGMPAVKLHWPAASPALPIVILLENISRGETRLESKLVGLAA